ncbi:ureidoglycolate lyase [Pelagibacterium lacus]|uniref:Ureidoglycolate lyase n=1 Tax=Pelagibacterium lacus TaxID=2282655 RepID=A0A369W360_9HYPH|nr:ureidoglycolate lyase [Pelagibacterium lacus]RDE09106.1 ureidoglycolate lyase [Pelagibacterium lacus]
MTRAIAIRPLDRAAFAPFGQVLATENAHHFPINGGMTERFHDLAAVEIGGENGRPLISIFRGRPYALPLTLSLVERHPLGSQAFMPLHPRPFLVIVAPDADGVPGTPLAFLTRPGMGINIARNVWHGVLTPLEAEGDFLVIDRGGDGTNLEEFTFAQPFTVAFAR